MSGSELRAFLRSCVPAGARDVARRVLGRPHPFGLAEADLQRLQGLPRYRAVEIEFFGRPLCICDAASFLSAWREIFAGQIYRFRATRQQPVIIDAGANIGLATIYLRRQYPESRIVALESDPQIFEILRSNLAAQNLGAVEILNRAVWDADEPLRFSQDHADAGRVGAGGEIHVQGMRFRSLLEQQDCVDFLKLDIEGAEARVLLDCESVLHRVQQIFVEYHSLTGQPQRLSELLGVLQRSGFRCYIERVGVRSGCPLVHIEVESGFDLQLNIFGIRCGI